MPDIDAPTVLNFLGYIEGQRRNLVQSRNVRLCCDPLILPDGLRSAIPLVSASPHEYFPSPSSHAAPRDSNEVMKRVKAAALGAADMKDVTGVGIFG